MIKKILFTLSIFVVCHFSSHAETLKTNIEGVVIKNVRCLKYSTRVEFNVVNRSQNRVQGKLRVTVIDQDNDPIDNGYTSVSLLPVSGEADYIACGCRSDTRYLFRFDN